MLQLPSAAAVVVPKDVDPFIRATCAPEAAVPVKVGVVSLVTASAAEVPESEEAANVGGCCSLGKAVMSNAEPNVDQAAEEALPVPNTFPPADPASTILRIQVPPARCPRNCPRPVPEVHPSTLKSPPYGAVPSSIAVAEASENTVSSKVTPSRYPVASSNWLEASNRTEIPEGLMRLTSR
jgi:hypothetical protein